MKLVYSDYVRNVYLKSSNKREKTCKLKIVYIGLSDFSDYYVFPLTSNDFDYYITHDNGTSNDWLHLIFHGECYKVKC